MAADFNPYHKWLGIPLADQPPHHYRLLGIDLFESDPQVIEAAADRQMTYIRTFQTGPNGELSQRILNELSAARLALLKTDKKAAYDQSLRARLAAAQAAQAQASARASQPIARAVSLASSRPADDTQADELASIVQEASSRSAKGQKEAAARKKGGRAEKKGAEKKGTEKKSSMLPLMLAGGGVAAILAVVGFVVMQRSGNPKRENAPTVGALISDGLPASDPSVDEKTKGAPGDQIYSCGFHRDRDNGRDADQPDDATKPSGNTAANVSTTGKTAPYSAPKASINVPVDLMAFDRHLTRFIRRRLAPRSHEFDVSAPFDHPLESGPPMAVPGCRFPNRWTGRCIA